ncbi:MerR family transcriptional regulator [Salipiger aestuarii]|uniref:MerR family transcriptional regulator n=1 Tax=Salipiger aestuarii TaxID=568098 RepID=UPI00123B8E18|nr:MerR family transcriptional regulator [Salipiger aestuarii]
MSKSRDAFRTISEVAELLDTPAHVLRFWESKFTQVKPVKRAGGRRYYRPGDIALLAGIKKLLHEDGLTIKGAQKVLREQGVKHVSSLVPLPIDTNAEEIEDAPFAEVAPETGTVLPFAPGDTPAPTDPADPDDQADLFGEAAADPAAEAATGADCETAPDTAPPLPDFVTHSLDERHDAPAVADKGPVPDDTDAEDTGPQDTAPKGADLADINSENTTPKDTAPKDTATEDATFPTAPARLETDDATDNADPAATPDAEPELGETLIDGSALRDDADTIPHEAVSPPATEAPVPAETARDAPETGPTAAGTDETPDASESVFETTGIVPQGDPASADADSPGEEIAIPADAPDAAEPVRDGDSPPPETQEPQAARDAAEEPQTPCGFELFESNVPESAPPDAHDRPANESPAPVDADARIKAPAPAAPPTLPDIPAPEDMPTARPGTLAHLAGTDRLSPAQSRRIAPHVAALRLWFDGHGGRSRT